MRDVKNISYIQRGIKKILFFLFFSIFLISPRFSQAIECLDNVEPKDYLKEYLQRENRESILDTADFISNITNLKTIKGIPYENAFKVAIISEKTQACFKENNYIGLFKIISENSSKDLLFRVAQNVSGYTGVTTLANLVDYGLKLLEQGINKTAINNVILNYRYYVDKFCLPSGKTIEECHAQILRCSKRAIEENDPSVCLIGEDANGNGAAGLVFTGKGWLIEPHGDGTEQIYSQPDLPFNQEFFYEGVKELYIQEKKIKEIDFTKAREDLIKEYIQKYKEQKGNNNQGLQKQENQNIFSKLLNWIGDGVKKAWSGVKNTIQKIGEAVKKPFTKNSENPQPALISEPLKQQEDKNEPQKIEEQKESISLPKEAEKKQDTAPKPAEAATPSIYKNPFQDFYDFYPRDGEAQKCIKSKLENKFSSFYNGVSIPTDGNSNSIEDCFDSIKNFFSLAPLSVQQCIKDAFGSDFELEKALNDPNYKESSEVENKLQNCPAFQEWMTKSGALDLYIKSNKVATPTVSPTTPEKEALPPKISIAPINIDVPATAGSATFYITTNESVFRYGVVVLEDWSWLSAKFSVNKDTGKTEGPITATYDANNSSSPRIGKITITAEGETGAPAIGSPVILTVTQATAQDLADTKLYRITATLIDEQNNIITEPLFFWITNLDTNEEGFGWIEYSESGYEAGKRSAGKLDFKSTSGLYKLSIGYYTDNKDDLEYITTINIDNQDLNLGNIKIIKK